MGFIRSLAILVYTLVLLVVGGILISLSLNLFSSDDLINAINDVYSQPNVKLILGIIGAVFVAVGFLTAQINFGRMQAEKTIAFENPEGQVTISLSAIEDFIKRSVRHLPEVKELRSTVTANKKGINVICRATIFAESNIPEITERIQSIVKSRVREMLGLEETINIKIHVTKISSKGKGEMPALPKESEEISRRMPFREA